MISNDSTEFFSDLGFYYVSVCEKFQEIDVKIILLGKMGSAQLGKTCKDKSFDLIYIFFFWCLAAEKNWRQITRDVVVLLEQLSALNSWKLCP